VRSVRLVGEPLGIWISAWDSCELHDTLGRLSEVAQGWTGSPSRSNRGIRICLARVSANAASARVQALGCMGISSVKIMRFSLFWTAPSEPSRSRTHLAMASPGIGRSFVPTRSDSARIDVASKRRARVEKNPPASRYSTATDQLHNRGTRMPGPYFRPEREPFEAGAETMQSMP
jgi:hypothetical protein